MLIEAIVGSNHDIEIIKKDLQNFADEIADDEKKSIEKRVQILENLIAEKSPREMILLAQGELEKSAENSVLKKVNSALSEKITGKKIDEV